MPLPTDLVPVSKIGPPKPAQKGLPKDLIPVVTGLNNPVMNVVGNQAIATVEQPLGDPQMAKAEIALGGSDSNIHEHQLDWLKQNRATLTPEQFDHSLDVFSNKKANFWTENQYYFDREGIPQQINFGEKAPDYALIQSKWGSQAQAEDDGLLTTLTKKAFNSFIDIVKLPATMIDLGYNLLGGEESTGLSDYLRNVVDAEKFNTSSASNEEVVSKEDVSAFKEMSDIFNTDNWNFSFQNIAGLLGSGLGMVGQMYVLGGGGATKALASEEVIGSEIAKKGLSMSQKLAPFAKATGANTLFMLNSSYDAAAAHGLKGRERMAVALTSAIGQGVIMSLMFPAKPYNPLTKGAQKEISDAAVKSFVETSAGKITPESLRAAYATTLKSSVSVLQKKPFLLAKHSAMTGNAMVVSHAFDNGVFMLSDKMHGKEGEGVFTPEAFRQYFNSWFSGAAMGLVGGIAHGVKKPELTEKQRQEDQSKMAYAYVKEGREAELIHNIDGLLANEQITPEDAANAKTRIAAYKRFNQETSDVKMTDEQREQVFNATWKAEGLKKQVADLEANETMTEAIKKAKIKDLHEQEKAEINEIASILGKAHKEAVDPKPEKESAPEAEKEPAVFAEEKVTPGSKIEIRNKIVGEFIAKNPKFIHHKPVEKSPGVFAPTETLGGGWVIEMEGKKALQKIKAGAGDVYDQVEAERYEARKRLKVGDVLEVRRFLPGKGKRFRISGREKEFHNHLLNMFDENGVQVGSVVYDMENDLRINNLMDQGHDVRVVITAKGPKEALEYQIISAPREGYTKEYVRERHEMPLDAREINPRELHDNIVNTLTTKRKPREPLNKKQAEPMERPEDTPEEAELARIMEEAQETPVAEPKPVEATERQPEAPAESKPIENAKKRPVKIKPVVEKATVNETDIASGIVHLSRDGKYRVVKTPEGLKVFDAKSKEMPKTTSGKIINEYLRTFDFEKGESALEGIPEGTIPEHGIDVLVAEHSEKPAEIIDTFTRIQSENPIIAGEYIEDMIAENLGKVKKTSYDMFGDKNNVTFGKAKAYFNVKGESIDTLAQYISERAGTEVTPQDIVDFIDRFPNGTDQYYREQKNPLLAKLKERFEIVAGFKLSPRSIEAYRDQEIKAHKIEEEFIQKEFETYEEAIKGYEKDIAEGRIKEENDSTDVSEKDGTGDGASEGSGEEIKFQSNDATERLASSDPELQQHILERLSKQFPRVSVFTDGERFQSFLERNFPGSKLDMAKLGAAVKNAVYINPNRAVQSTAIHEYAHIYWDSLPEGEAIKKELIKYFKSEEAAITAIGKLGTKSAEIGLKGTMLQKFLESARKFWAKVKNAFGIANEKDLTRIFADKIWNAESTSKANDADLKVELRKIGVDEKIVNAIPDSTTLSESFFAGHGNILDNIKAVRGTFDPIKDTIIISKLFSSFTKSGKDQLLLHEAAHAATVLSFRDILKNPKQYSDQQVKAANAINDVFWDYKMNTSSAATLLSQKIYGLTNSYEFIAEFISNPKFRDYISKNAPKKEVGFLRYVWNNILDILGVTKKPVDQNILSDIENNIDTILLASKDRIEGERNSLSVENKVKFQSEELTPEQDRVASQLRSIADHFDYNDADHTYTLKETGVQYTPVNELLEGDKKYSYKGKSNPESSGRGKELHALAESIVRGEDFEAALAKTSLKITPEAKEQFRSQVNKVIESLRGKGSVLPETIFASSYFKTAGRPDLPIIAKDGTLHIYDFKTSTMSTEGALYEAAHGQKAAKKDRDGTQLAMYAKLAEHGDAAMGVDAQVIGEVGIIPIRLTVDKSGMITKVTVEKTADVPYDNYRDEARRILSKQRKGQGEKDAKEFKHAGAKNKSQYLKFHKIDERALEDELANLGDTEADNARAEEIYSQLESIQKQFKKYQEDFQKVKNLEDADLTKYSYEELIDAMNTINSYDSLLHNIAMKEIQVEAGRRMSEMEAERLAKKGVKAGPEKDLTASDVFFKALSDIPETLPALQGRVRDYFSARQAEETEHADVDRQAKKLFLDVIREKEKDTGVISKLTKSFRSTDMEKYFENLFLKKADQDGPALLKDWKDLSNNLSQSERTVLKFMNEKMSEFQQKQALSERGYWDGFYAEISPNYWETYHRHGFLEALSAKLRADQPDELGDMEISVNLNGEKKVMTYDQAEIAIKGAGEKNILTKAAAALKLTRAYGDAKKAHDMYVAKMAGTESQVKVRGAASRYTLNENGEMVSKFHWKRPKEKDVSYDVYRSFMSYMTDAIHVKHMQPLLPELSALETYYKERGANPNTVKFMQHWIEGDIFGKEFIGQFGRKVDAGIKFLQGWTYLNVMSFNPRVGLFNLITGKLNQLRAEGFKKSIAKGEPRYWKNPTKAQGILAHYTVIEPTVKGPDKYTAENIWGRGANAFVTMGENSIRGAAFFSNMTDAEYRSVEANFDNKGNIIDKSKDLAPGRVFQIKKAAEDIQGKYSFIDKRMYKHYGIMSAMMGFKGWMPDWLKERFGEEYVDAWGVTHKGSLRSIPAIFRDLKGTLSNWNGDGVDAVNNRKNAREVLLLATMMGIYATVNGDDDEKKQGSILLTMSGDLIGLMNLSKTKSTIAKPFPFMGTVSNFVDAMYNLMSFYTRDGKFGKKGDWAFPGKILTSLPYNHLVKEGLSEIANPDYSGR